MSVNVRRLNQARCGRSNRVAARAHYENRRKDRSIMRRGLKRVKETRSERPCWAENEARQGQMFRLVELAGCQAGLMRRDPGEAPDEDLRIDEGRHCRADALARRPSTLKRTSSPSCMRPLRNVPLAGDRGVQWPDFNLRFALTPTLSLQERGFCKGLFIERASRTAPGIVIWPSEFTRAETCMCESLQ